MSPEAIDHFPKIINETRVLTFAHMQTHAQADILFIYFLCMCILLSHYRPTLFTRVRVQYVYKQHAYTKSYIYAYVCTQNMLMGTYNLFAHIHMCTHACKYIISQRVCTHVCMYIISILVMACTHPRKYDGTNIVRLKLVLNCRRGFEYTAPAPPFSRPNSISFDVL